MTNQTQEAFGSDAQLEKHAKEYHGLSLAQFKLMCDEADKRYEGQFSNSVDKALAVESFYEGFKVAIKEALEQPDNMVTVPADKLEKMQKELKRLRKKVQEVKDKETNRSWGVFS